MVKRQLSVKWIKVISAIILISLLLVTACGPGTTVPGGEQVVELGILTPATGPVSGGEQISLTSHLDYVNYFNEMMPIPGVTIAARWIDVDAQLSLGISAYRRFVERGVPVLSSNDLELTETLAATGVLEKDQTILITSSTVEPLVYPVKPWIYGCAPTWGEEFAVLADYIMENWKEDNDLLPQLEKYVGELKKFEPEFKQLLHACVGMDVNFSSIGKIMVWPKSPSGKVSASVEKECGQHKVTIIESNTANWTDSTDFSFRPYNQVYPPTPYVENPK